MPEDFGPVTGVAIGYVGEAERLPEELRQRELAPRDRKPPAEWLFAGSWGRARYD